MEISKVYQTPEQVTVSAQSAQTSQAGEKTKVAEVVQKDFQVNLQDGLKTKLAEFANILQNREQLILSLPEDIKKAVVELLQQMSTDTELPQGLENLFKGQKNTSEQLKNMSNILDFSAVLQQDEHSEVKVFLQQASENFSKQTEQTPAQSAKELVQLAKQLPMSHTVAQGILSQALEEVLKQTVPENIQQLNQNQQKSLVKLTNVLGQDMPAQLQQLAQEKNLPELPGVWVLFKIADALQFKDIQPKTLQAAADLFNQIAQEMSPEEGTVVAQLEKFVQSLPPEVSTKEAVVAQLKQFAQSLPSEVSTKGAIVAQLEQFVQTLSPEVSTKETVVAQLKQFAQSLPSEVSTKGAIVAQLEQFVQTLSPEVSTKGTVVAQLEQFVQSLPPEVNTKGVAQLEQFVQPLPPEVSPKGAVAMAQLEQFVKTLPPEIGKALEQALKQGKIPDSLRGLADTFSNAVVLNETMSNDMQAVVVKNVEKFLEKFPLLSTDGDSVLTGLIQQFTDTNTTVEQLKNLTQQLKTQMFVGDPKLLEQELPVLDKITKLFEPNIPQVLQEGIVKQKLPELPKIWTLLQALGTEQWQNITNRELQKSAGVVKELAQSIYKATNLTGEKQAEHSTLSFSIPLNVAAGVYYPAHIHIYHEQKESSNPLTQREFETWLRVSVDTENIGMVDSVFRLYGDNKLDVRVNFPVMSAANQFAQDLPDVRKSLDGIKLSVTDIMINKA